MHSEHSMNVVVCDMSGPRRNTIVISSFHVALRAPKNKYVFH